MSENIKTNHRLNNLLVVNLHDLISHVDGVETISEEKIDGIYKRLASTLDGSSPTKIIILKEGEEVSSPWDKRRLPDGMQEVETLLSKLGINVQEVGANPIESAVAKVVNDVASDYDNVYVYDSSVYTNSLIDDKSVLVLNTDYNFKKIFEVDNEIGLEGSDRIKAISIKGLSSRGIKSIPRVREVEAYELLKTYGSVKEIYNNLNELPSSKSKMFKVHKGKLSGAYKALTSPVISFEYVVNDFNKSKVSDYSYSKIKDTRIQKNLLVGTEYSGAGSNIITSISDLADIFKIAKQSDHKSLVLTPVRVKDQIIGLAIGSGSESDGYIPLKEEFDNKEILSEIKTMAKAESLMLVTLDGKALAKSYLANDVEPISVFLDLSLVAYSLGKYLESSGNFSEEQICKAFDEEPAKTATDFFGEYFNGIDPAAVRPEFVAKYCSSLIKKVNTLGVKAKEEINKDVGGKRFYATIDMPHAVALARMEYQGVYVDYKIITNAIDKIDVMVKEKNKEMEAVIGVDIPIEGEKGMTSAIADFRKANIENKDDTEVVLKLKRVGEMATELRSLKRGLVTARKELRGNISKVTGRVHASFNQKTAVTGRLSCNGPNLQGVENAGKSEVGRLIRSAFSSSDASKVIVSADYSQMEIRILAHLSGDKHLIEQLNKGEDIHLLTAADMFGVPVNEVTKEQRSSAKSVNFGIPYGTTEFGLAKSLGKPVDVAKSYLESYFEIYPGVKKYINDQVAFAKKNGYVNTMGGRKVSSASLNSKTINSDNFSIRSKAERCAVNYAIQGSAADMVKKGFNHVDAMISKMGLDTKVLIQVHDELVFETSKENVKEVSEKVQLLMENVLSLCVPVVVDVDIARDWAGSPLKETEEKSCQIKSPMVLIDREYGLDEALLAS
jgi:DNA polymerase-1